jgi:pectate lyase
MRMLTIAAMVLPLAACQSNWEKQGQAAQVSGAGTSRSYAATGFTQVDLRGPDNVDVKTGSAFAVTAEGEAKVLDTLDIRVVDGTLRIGRKDRDGGWFSNDQGARIHVTLPRLSGASVAGSGDLSVDKADGDFDAAVAGSGNLSIAALRAGALELSVAGSGDLSVAGTADKLEANIAGSGNIEAGKLSAARAEVSIAGSGDVRAMVKGPAEVSIVGSGDAELTGGAKCEVSALGSGEARCS